MVKSKAKASPWRDRVLRLERVRAGDLVGNPQNWRRHPLPQVEALKGVLSEVGFAGALLAYQDDGKLTLIDGHLRAGLDPEAEVPVLVLDVDRGEARKLLATYDPLGAMAAPDQDALLALLATVSSESQAVKDMLEALANGSYAPLVPMPDMEAEVGLTDEDEVPEPNEPYVKRGDIWLCGEHRVLCGDATKDIPQLLNGQKVDVLLTDPPYGISIVKAVSNHGKALGLGSTNGAKPFGRMRQPGGKVLGVLGGDSGQRLAKLVDKGRIGGGGNVGEGIILTNAQRARHKNIVQPNLYPIITGDEGPFDPSHLLGLAPLIILFGGNYYASRLPDSKCWLVWDKGMSPENSFSDAELLWTNQDSHVRMYRHTWSGLVREGNRDEELLGRIHPTQKPVGLLGQILQDFSEEKQIILDPYLGSGSMLIACEKLGRICYGMEIEPRYVQVAIERWQNYTGRKAVKIGDDNSHPD